MSSLVYYNLTELFTNSTVKVLCLMVDISLGKVEGTSKIVINLLCKRESLQSRTLSIERFVRSFSTDTQKFYIKVLPKVQ